MQPRDDVTENDTCWKVGDTAGRECSGTTALRTQQGAGGSHHLLDTRAAQTVPALEADRIVKDTEAGAADGVIVGGVSVTFLLRPLQRGVGFLRRHGVCLLDYKRK